MDVILCTSKTQTDILNLLRFGYSLRSPFGWTFRLGERRPMKINLRMYLVHEVIFGYLIAFVYFQSFVNFNTETINALNQWSLTTRVEHFLLNRAL